MRTKRLSAPRLAMAMVVLLGSIAGPVFGFDFPFGRSRASSWLEGFGYPMACKDHIVFTRGYGDKLICMDLNGKKIWEKQDQYFTICGQRDDNSIVIQMDRRVVAIDVPTGKETCLFETRSRGERVCFDRDSALLWSYIPWKDRRFRVLDRESGDVLWKNSRVRHVICATENMVICITGKGSFCPENIVYWLENPAVEAFDRRSGKLIWKTPLSEEFNHTSLRTLYISRHVVIAGTSKMISLRDSDGRIVSTAQNENKNIFFANVFSKSEDNMLMYLTNKAELVNNKIVYRSFLHSYSVPQLQQEVATELASTDWLVSLTTYGDYVITEVGTDVSGVVFDVEAWGATGSTTACFEARTGRQIWAKNHYGRSEPADGKLYFCGFADSKDLKELTARISVVDIASGKEAILYEEKMPANSDWSF